ncbi:hypothetical protein HELRODRAFT_183688 [Helobdella robusta]|uniref:Endonuclease/exonuclease/phosphatase domain-containing protein n=1 Tax=Helobdella robusta TaxID=6412 RepID=T1FK15_HELRO|nr:hypothetical protein HELRODRAFT_183688 [Helobdella robusta]ESO10364.1 hypothetical protein HELRODRAFT_183688 [Helobdella robusta]
MSSQKKKRSSIPWKTLNGQGVTISRKHATVEGCCGKSNVLSWNIRLGTLNTGLLTGRSMETVDMMERRRVDIRSLQETRWKSNGVALIGSYIMGKHVLTVISAYAPETSESEDSKNDFWNVLSDAVRKTPSSEIPLMCGDLTFMLEIKQMSSTVSVEALATDLKTKTVYGFWNLLKLSTLEWMLLGPVVSGDQFLVSLSTVNKELH